MIRDKGDYAGIALPDSTRRHSSLRTPKVRAETDLDNLLVVLVVVRQLEKIQAALLTAVIAVGESIAPFVLAANLVHRLHVDNNPVPLTVVVAWYR
ncbi:MAG TPA: hypothetical protein VHI13_19355 [Candidatus Kapabacteria bacterium]|nr:hypothetical protein [Candidatus Kapabacteria bacterium]